MGGHGNADEALGGLEVGQTDPEGHRMMAENAARLSLCKRANCSGRSASSAPLSPSAAVLRPLRPLYPLRLLPPLCCGIRPVPLRTSRTRQTAGGHHSTQNRCCRRRGVMLPSYRRAVGDGAQVGETIDRTASCGRGQGLQLTRLPAVTRHRADDPREDRLAAPPDTSVTATSYEAAVTLASLLLWARSIEDGPWGGCRRRAVTAAASPAGLRPREGRKCRRLRRGPCSPCRGSGRRRCR